MRTLSRQGRRQVNGRGGLAHTTLLVRDRDDTGRIGEGKILRLHRASAARDVGDLSSEGSGPVVGRVSRHDYLPVDVSRETVVVVRPLAATWSGGLDHCSPKEAGRFGHDALAENEDLGVAEASGATLLHALRDLALDTRALEEKHLPAGGQERARAVT